MSERAIRIGGFAGASLVVFGLLAAVAFRRGVFERGASDRDRGPSVSGSIAESAGGAESRENPDSGEAREQPFFDWTDLPFPREEYLRRRRGLIAELEPRGTGIFLVPARDGFSSGETFRQNDDFNYLTGLELPNSMLALDVRERRSQLFVPERDARFENPSRPNDFPGRRLVGDGALARRSGIADFRPVEELDGQVRQWVREGRCLFVNPGRRDEIPTVESSYLSSWTPEQSLLFHLQSSFPEVKIESAFRAVARLRSVKSAAEIEVIRRACRLTAESIAVAARSVREGVDERTLEGELEAAFKRGGSQRMAFSSIIKSGPNSLWPWRILAAHYDRRNRSMRSSELVIFDVGCEVDYYASDVGRTFPVSGRFTPEQASRLRMITAVSDAMIEAVRPGTTFVELQAIAEAKIPPEERRFMQTGQFFGHPIGLAVGDPMVVEEPLRAGMVFTVEPWYYNHDEAIAVFVEDNILVTDDGSENLTADLPRTIDGLEAMVR